MKATTAFIGKACRTNLLLILGIFSAASASAETIVVSPADPALNGGYVYPRLLEEKRDLATLVPRGEGWVLFATDIDTTGKASNVRVLRTSGNAVQVRHVLDHVAEWRWQPATSGGMPVHETALRLVRFQTRKPMDAKADAAAGEAFAATVRAVESGDRAAAESQLDKLRQRESNNSAEYTLQKIAESLVQRRWGTPLAELEALTDAFAGGSGAFAGLPPQYQRSATMDLLRLRLAAGQYGDARNSAQAAERLTDDKATKTKLAGVLARIAEIESSTEPFRMQTSLGPGGFAFAALLRHRFAIANGLELSRAVVHCREGAVLLQLPAPPGADFQIDDKATECRLHLQGTPGGVVVIEER